MARQPGIKGTVIVYNNAKWQTLNNETHVCFMDRHTWVFLYQRKDETMENFIENAPLFVVVLLLAAGFVLLIKGADFFVEGSASIAKRFSVPPIIIGLTIVAMGTSLPETAVSVAASLADNNELAVSNVVGSNIFNLMMVLGICALLTPVAVQEDTIRRDIPFSAVCAVLLLGLGVIGIADPTGMALGHLDGIIMLILFVAYIIILVRKALQSRKQDASKDTEEDGDAVVLSIPKSLLFIVGGGIAIVLGGDLTVDAATRVALDFGMSQTLVGLTIVSIGTSLPELVTSIVAARKKQVDMAFGNAIGSNVFNILMVLGIASAISPIAFIMENIIDIVMLLAFTVIAWFFAGTKRQISRKEGTVMLVLYAAYTAYIFIR